MKTKEAIERVRSRFNEWALDEEDLTALQTLGLVDKESEDERIRKEIIRIVDIWTGSSPVVNGIPRETLLDYLEKQKEQKPVDIGFVSDWLRKHIKAYVNSEYNEFHKTVEYDGSINIEHLIEDLKKAIEQQSFVHKNDFVSKPAEWSYPYGRNETVDRLVSIAECLEMDGDCLFNGYTGTECGKFLRDLARKQVECKSVEWSKEDEKCIHYYLP